MIIHELVQGSPEWLAYRREKLNASDAPAMLGCSPYTSRDQLIKQMALGTEQVISKATQKIFDDGHLFEALARPLAEAIIAEDLYPVTGSEGVYSASFDGLNILQDVAFEHKTLNEALREVMTPDCTGADLPKVYRVQMEQQCMVSGCSRVLFMASKWEKDGDGNYQLVEERHCWYAPDLALREEIIKGWEIFLDDVKNYVHVEKAEVVAEAVIDLPSLIVRVTGELSITDNYAQFGADLNAYLDRINRTPETDQDFANLETAVKVLKKTESALDKSEELFMSQVQAVDLLKRTKDMLHKLARDHRLLFEKLIKSEKDNRRSAIIAKAKADLAEHVAAINATMERPFLQEPVADFAGAIKGKSSIDSIQNAVNSELARAKIEVNTLADTVRANLALLASEASEHKFLFADVRDIIQKNTDDLANLIKMRIAEHDKAEQEKIARIRAEEQAKAEAKAKADAEENNKRVAEGERAKLERAVGRATAEMAESTIEPSRKAQQAAVNFEGAEQLPTERAKPSKHEMVIVLSEHFEVEREVAEGWLIELAESLVIN